MIPLTDKSARELARRVAEQSSGVKVKFGRTNGQPVLHLVRSVNDAREIAEGTARASETIASAVEWHQHRWNRYNQPKAKPAEVAA